ncbi:MAG: FAD-dependent oxidoreductase, partial [Gloeobacteraceae cyanobacterium ES-bin-316]|nr:FAD-dependent oxidoreductase [Ferruginibacter sp.]
TRFTMRHIAEPFTFGDPLYRTGISVGDYPIDHHHGKNPSVAQHLDFYSIPSYNVPLGALIPKNFDNLIIAEKGISVSNVANGSTRLQPCVLLTGQAAGTMAALSSLKKEKPAEIPVRTVQNSLLQAKAYIMPYIDIMPTSPYFEAVQKIGATGILRGKGIPYRWANQTWFYPDSMVEAKSLCENLNEFKQAAYVFSGKHVLVSEAITIVEKIRPNFGAQGSNKTPKASAVIKSKWKNWGLTNFDPNRHITRLELAVLLQKTVDPFAMKAINHQGRFKE